MKPHDVMSSQIFMNSPGFMGSHGFMNSHNFMSSHDFMNSHSPMNSHNFTHESHEPHGSHEHHGPHQSHEPREPRQYQGAGVHRPLGPQPPPACGGAACRCNGPSGRRPEKKNIYATFIHQMFAENISLIVSKNKYFRRYFYYILYYFRS